MNSSCHRILLIVSFGLASVSGRSVADEVEHPTYTNWARFPVGTKVTMKSTTTIKGQQTESLTITTLIRKDEKSLVISKRFKTDNPIGTQTDDPVESTIKRMFPLLPGVDKSKIGKPQGDGPSGVETVDVLGKNYEADWYESQGSTEAGPSTTRTWISMEMPGRILKSVTEIKAVGKKVVDEIISLDIPESK